MKALLSYVLLGVGFLCAGLAFSIVAGAEKHQSGVARSGTEPVVEAPGRGVIYPPGAVARLRFGRQRRDVFVWGDERPENLKKGPVWLRMTRSFTSPGNTVVAGHRDTHFWFLKDTRVGDIFEVDQGNLQLAFRITMIRIVVPTDRALLAPTAQKTVTLVTCYPFYVVGRADRRMILRAEVVTE